MTHSSLAPRGDGFGRISQQENRSIVPATSCLRAQWYGSHATLRAFFTVFRTVGDFFRDNAAVICLLGAALTADRNFSLGCFAVRW
jgi:hypothetical protein